MQFSSYFKSTDSKDCVVEINKFKGEASGKCEQIADKNLYHNLILRSLMKESDNWTFIVYTVLIVLGLVTNSVCLAVFIHSKYLLPKMGNRESFILFTVSNIVYLSTMWFLNIQPPYFMSSDSFIRNYPTLFSILTCKLLFYINLSSFFLSELIIVSISLHRVLQVFFPMKMVLLSAKCPRFFEYTFLCVVLLALSIPVINLIYNSNNDILNNQNIVEPINLMGYCHISNRVAGKKLFFHSKVFIF